MTGLGSPADGGDMKSSRIVMLSGHAFLIFLGVGYFIASVEQPDQVGANMGEGWPCCG
jgi:hypothetical protein